MPVRCRVVGDDGDEGSSSEGDASAARLRIFVCRAEPGRTLLPVVTSRAHTHRAPSIDCLLHQAPSSQTSSRQIGQQRDSRNHARAHLTWPRWQAPPTSSSPDGSSSPPSSTGSSWPSADRRGTPVTSSPARKTPMQPYWQRSTLRTPSAGHESFTLVLPVDLATRRETSTTTSFGKMSADANWADVSPGE